MDTSINNLITKGFVRLTYSEDFSVALDRAIQSWEKFCALPVATKKGLPYSDTSTGVGYEFKEGTGHMGDRKENFDMTVDGRHWLDAHIGQIEDPIALDFVKDVTALVPLIRPLAIDFARIVREAYRPLFGFVGDVEQSEGSFFVRFIHYAGDREVGEETATAHVDQSAFTLHLFESDYGFQCLTYDDKKWVDVPVSPVRRSLFHHCNFSYDPEVGQKLSAIVWLRPKQLRIRDDTQRFVSSN